MGRLSMGKKKRIENEKTSILVKNPILIMFMYGLFFIALIFIGIMIRAEGKFNWKVALFSGIIISLFLIVVAGEAGVLKKNKKFIYLLFGILAGAGIGFVLNPSAPAIVIGVFFGMILGAFLPFIVSMIINVI